MLQIRIIKANTEIPITKNCNSETYPIKSIENEKNTKAIKSGILLLNFATNHPEIGRPIKELIGMANKRFPSSASLKSKFDFIVGILDAQEAKQKPNKKKYVLKDIRWEVFLFIDSEIRTANIRPILELTIKIRH